MYVYMYVYNYVCMYVCMYVCTGTCSKMSVWFIAQYYEKFRHLLLCSACSTVGGLSRLVRCPDRCGVLISEVS